MSYMLLALCVFNGSTTLFKSPINIGMGIELMVRYQVDDEHQEIVCKLLN